MGFGRTGGVFPIVSEDGSPGRFTSRAKEFDIRAGYAMDLRSGWDFTRQGHRDSARDELKANTPWLLIGSPPCGPFSTMHQLFPWTEGRDRNYWHLMFLEELYAALWLNPFNEDAREAIFTIDPPFLDAIIPGKAALKT